MTSTVNKGSRPPRRWSGAELGIWSAFKSLLAAQIIAAVLGLVFWVLVARLVSPQEVGVAAAAISAQTLIGMLATVGLGTFLIAELPLHDPPRQRVLLVRSLVVTAVVGVCLGAVVVACSSLLGGNLREVLTNPVGAVTFVVGTAAASWGTAVDGACLGLKQPGVQVTRNLVASALRFPVTVGLLAVGFTDAEALQLCWVIPLLISTPYALWRLRLPRGDTSSPRVRADVAAYLRPALHNHVLSMALAGASLLLPVVAALMLTSVENAQFTIAWLIASFVFLPPYLLATALFAHGANVTTDEFRKSMGRTVPIGLLVSALLCLGTWTLGKPALLIFGEEYSSQSWQILALLVPVGLWLVFKDHLMVLWRAQQRFALASRLAAAATALEVAGAAVGAVLGGATGLCLGWLAAIGVEIVLGSPWLREGFRGLDWQWPHPSHLRGQAGRVAHHVVAAVVLVGLVAAGGIWSATRGGDSPGPSTSSPTSASGSTTDPGCRTSADLPGPQVDLAVQAATGNREAPLRDDEEVRRLVRLAKGAGATIIATAASFRAQQPVEGGPYGFTGMDRVIDAARAAGLDVRLRLGGMPTWALDESIDNGRQPPETAAELKRWETFVTDLMQHVRGRVDYVEVWNEPNSQKWWPTGPDPIPFVRLLTTTYRAVHAAAPNVQVISGGLIGNDIGYLEQMYEAAETLGLKALPLDVLGVHPFNASASPTEVDPGMRYERDPWGLIDENFSGFKGLYDVMADRGDEDVPIFITQFGYSTRALPDRAAVPDALRASYLTEAFRIATCESYVTAFSWYALHPTRWDPAGWTLLNEAGRPNQTYAALRAWSEESSQ